MDKDDDLPGMLAVAKGVHEGRWPHSMDAQVWAQEWIKTINEHPKIPTDEETMIGWFANAIMAGYDNACMRSADGKRMLQLEDAVRKLWLALSFYAAPETYVAIGFFPAPPCGEFIDDFSVVDYGPGGNRPGKKARDALDEVGKNPAVIELSVE